MEIKKERIWFFVLAAMFFIWGITSEIFAAKPVTLSYANMFPPTHVQSKLPEAWCKEVEKRTNGKVKITYYPGESLLKGNTIYNGVVNGIADIGYSVFGYNRGVFTAMEAFSLPHGFKSGSDATRVINEFCANFKLKELSKVKVLYLHAHGPAQLHSKKEIHTLKDMHGLKVRSYGFNAAMVKALGGIPVSMTQASVYEALQKGVTQATFSPSEVLKGWKQAEVVDYSIDATGVAYSTAMYAIMNLDRWNALSKEVQKVIEEINQEWIVKTGKAWDQSDAEGRKYTLAQGNQIITLKDAENQKWAKAVEPIVEDYIAKANKEGLPGRSYVDFIRQSLNKK